ncbi:MAG: 3-oxoacyl-ACP reductase family protein [Devosia sp.]
MKNPMDMSNRTVVVTGAAQGIGKATCELVCELGGNVVAVDVSDKLVGALGHLPPERVMTVRGDVSDWALAETSVAQAVERFGAIHGLVNNAGIVRAALIERMTPQQWDDVIRVHLTGAFVWLQAVGRHMIERRKAGNTGSASIVNISSDAGRKGSFGQANYAAAKSGMFGLSMTAAREWGRYGIRTNSVCFGVVETEMTETIRSDKFRDRTLANIPLQRYAQPEEVVQTVCFLLSDASSYTTGQQISSNGGNNISV